MLAFHFVPVACRMHLDVTGQMCALLTAIYSCCASKLWPKLLVECTEVLNIISADYDSSKEMCRLVSCEHNIATLPFSKNSDRAWETINGKGMEKKLKFLSTWQLTPNTKTYIYKSYIYDFLGRTLTELFRVEDVIKFIFFGSTELATNALFVFFFNSK